MPTPEASAKISRERLQEFADAFRNAGQGIAKGTFAIEGLKDLEAAFTGIDPRTGQEIGGILPIQNALADEGLFTVNEARGFLGLDPIPNGDRELTVGPSRALTFADALVGRIGGPVGFGAGIRVGKAKRIGTTGQFVGAPKGIDTPQKLAGLDQRLKNLALEAVEANPLAKFWYERSGKAILELTGGDIDKADTFAQLLASLSTLTPVQNNLDFALRAWNQFHTGGKINVGMFPGKMSKEVLGILDGTGDVTGLKRGAFYANLMSEIDPTRVPEGAVTVDRWILEALGFERSKSGVTASQNAFGQERLQKLAKELGWEPHQVQAAIWVAQKARKEGRGFLAASFDFSNALETTRGQVSWEAIPHPDIQHLPKLFTASPEVKADYHRATAAAFLDDAGQDIVAKDLGLLSPGDFEAPAAFEGVVQPGAQTLLAVPAKKTAKAGARIDPDTRLLIDVYAGLRAGLLRQKAIAWHRPVFQKPVIRHNGYSLQGINRSLTPEETTAFYDAIQKHGGPADWAPIGTQDGANILNFEEFSGISNKKFHTILDQAVEEVFEKQGKSVTFSSEGNYLDSNPLEDLNGQAHTSIAGRAGRPDLQERVDDLYTRIGPKLDAIDETFAEDLGDTFRRRISSDQRPATKSPTLDTRAPADAT